MFKLLYINCENFGNFCKTTEAINLIANKDRIKAMEEKAKAMGLFGAADTIAKIVIEEAKKKK